MKTFLDPKNDGAEGRQKAQGCLATNLVMPGLGSLAGGRKIGLVQLVLCLAGFAITLGFGTRFIYWALAHWSEFYGQNVNTDPMGPLRDLWQQARWPFLGMGLFGAAWLWALSTSRSLIADAKKAGPGG